MRISLEPYFNVFQVDEDDLDLELFGHKKIKPDIRLSVYEFEVGEQRITLEILSILFKQ